MGLFMIKDAHKQVFMYPKSSDCFFILFRDT